MFGRVLKGSFAKSLSTFRRISFSHDGDFAYFPIRVENPLSIIDASKVSFNKEIDIVIKTHSPDELPYHGIDLFDPEKNDDLVKYGITREAVTRIVLRGDSRNIVQINEVGGFHPRFTDPSLDPLENRHPLDILDHRQSPWGSGFVSTTISQQIAHGFGQAYGYFTARDNVPARMIYTVYTLVVTGAMTPSHNHSEKEFSIPGGIDKEGIVAYRHCEAKDVKGSRNLLSLSLSSIFVNKNFAKNNPHLVQDVVQTQLLCDERIVDHENKLRM